MRNRLHALCPYFAMFPETFVEDYVGAFTKKGDFVYDPFSGRGTTLLQALLMGREAISNDINPVAFCISGAKAHIPLLKSVIAELNGLESQYRDCSRPGLEDERQELPPFFRRAFHHTTLRQILFLRRVLNWQHDAMHRFIAAMALGSLHGEMDKSSAYFSNQMPRTISVKPGYSLRFWRKNGLWPKKRDVFNILRSRAHFRLSGELPERHGQVALRDVREATLEFSSFKGQIRAIITSPPYFDVTNYEEDQWLRLWFLGYPPYPTYGTISKDDRHSQKDKYWSFLTEAWAGVGPLLQHDAVLVCRIGGKGMGESEITRGLFDSLAPSFPGVHLVRRPHLTMLHNRQTDAFRPGSSGCRFEIDYCLCLPEFAGGNVSRQRLEQQHTTSPLIGRRTSS